MKYQDLQAEIRSQEIKISKITEEIKSIDSKTNDIILKINAKYLSISIEEILLSLPNNAIGSERYAQKLNSQSGLYEDFQFNKIIRFLTLIEAIERDYNELYFSIGEKYLTNPNKKDVSDLIEKYSLLKNEYKLMGVLVEAVISDKVLFNKIYNVLEDRGVFMTKYDKYNYENLSSLASNMVTLVEESFQINEHLSNINHELWETNNKLDDINDSLGRVDIGVKAGNLLRTVQTYQLYRINKNTKG